jgi:hypothetical protein
MAIKVVEPQLRDSIHLDFLHDPHGRGRLGFPTADSCRTALTVDKPIRHAVVMESERQHYCYSKRNAPSGRAPYRHRGSRGPSWKLTQSTPTRPATWRATWWAFAAARLIRELQSPPGVVVRVPAQSGDIIGRQLDRLGLPSLSEPTLAQGIWVRATDSATVLLPDSGISLPELVYTKGKRKLASAYAADMLTVIRCASQMRE